MMIERAGKVGTLDGKSPLVPLRNQDEVVRWKPAELHKCKHNETKEILVDIPVILQVLCVMESNFFWIMVS